jgi:hypothetical protein
MDGGGVLYDDKDPAHVARLMDACVTDPALADAISRRRTPRSTGCGEGLRGTLLRFVDGVLRPRRGRRPAVPFDFWEQFALAERLEEIRSTARRSSRRCREPAPPDRGGPGGAA